MTVADDYPVMAATDANRLRPDLVAEIIRALDEIDRLRQAVVVMQESFKRLDSTNEILRQVLERVMEP